MNRHSKHQEGYLTVYLALVMAVMISLYLALIEGVRYNACRLEAECVTDIGLNSVLAEYHKELFDRYNLFAVDSSYGTMRAGSSNVEQHLQRYMNRNFSVEDVFLSGILYRDFLALEVESLDVTKVSILTDRQGAVFRRRAVEAVKDDVGLTMLENLINWLDVVESNGLNERNVSAEKEVLDGKLAAREGEEVQLTEQEWATVDIVNPTDGLEKIRRLGILSSVVEETASLSAKRISETSLIGARMAGNAVSLGNYPVQETTKMEEFTERFFFQEYLLKYMESYISSLEKNAAASESTALDYQMEYLIAGKEADGDNLRTVANWLCAIREVSNAIYLYSDETKCAEAELLAAGLAALCFLPELTEVFKHTLLLGWSYAESVHDVKVLLAGGRVPLLKDETSWYYDLETALSLGDMSEQEASVASGLSYEDYLRILMSFTNLDTLTTRAMNMVEANIRLSQGNESFRLDACYDCLEVFIDVTSAYGYQYEITRRKSY